MNINQPIKDWVTNYVKLYDGVTLPTKESFARVFQTTHESTEHEAEDMYKLIVMEREKNEK